MQDLSLHLLDIVENSIRAQATQITIELNESVQNNTISLIVADNGKGMNKEMLSKVKDPFVTSRTTRRVGLGVSLLHQNCLNAGGELRIQSEEGKGTKLEAFMQYNHVDRLPLGDLTTSVIMLIQANPKINFIYKHIYNEKVFCLSTYYIKEMLGDVAINETEIIQWLKQYMKQNLIDLYKVGHFG